jgi:Transcription factor WhiB
MTIMQDQALNVTQLPGWELSRLVIGTADQPCSAPGANPEDWFPIEPVRDAQADPSGDKYKIKAAELEARAAALCRGCPVGVACLERAIALEGPAPGYGIAGGQTARRRQDIKISRGLVSVRHLAGAA